EPRRWRDPRDDPSRRHLHVVRRSPVLPLPPLPPPPGLRHRGPVTQHPGPALAFQGVSASLGSRQVLREVDLVVRPGEFVALAGPNGAGKTTLLRVALGLVPSSAGTARLFGSP